MNKIRTAVLTAGIAALLLLGRFTPALAAPGDPVTQPSLDPNAPGVKGLQALSNALLTYVLVGCLIAFLVCLLLLPVSKAIQIEQMAVAAKIGLVVCLVVAFVAGIVGALINWAYRTGSGSLG